MVGSSRGGRGAVGFCWAVGVVGGLYCGLGSFLGVERVWYLSRGGDGIALVQPS